MSEQPSLFDYKPATESVLVKYLRCRGWMRSKELIPITGLTERQLRFEAELSDGRIISGQKGYCLIENATLSEIHHAGQWLIKQGNKMRARGLKILAKTHTRQ